MAGREMTNKDYESIEKAHQEMTKKGSAKKSVGMAEQKRYRYGVGRRIRRARSA